MNNKRIYAAYGSNMNREQMSIRCPSAEYLGMATIHGCRLVFKGSATGAHATLIPDAASSVRVALWELTREDERELDLYEGYPKYYEKWETNALTDEGETVRVMIYIMTEMPFGLPAPMYFYVIVSAYESLKLDPAPLYSALTYSAVEYYRSSAEKIGIDIKKQFPEID